MLVTRLLREEETGYSISAFDWRVLLLPKEEAFYPYLAISNGTKITCLNPNRKLENLLISDT